jgi:hypothetical protein
VQYLVKWEDYDWSHNSWIHKDDLPEEVIQQFELQQNAGVEDQSRRGLRSSRNDQKQ